jgi:pimeloyl-ACP methyl ester carboxylesterase
MTWQELAVDSEALQGNPLGDPATRPLFVCTPPGYADDPARRYPAVYLLHGMTSQARAWFNVSPFTPTLADQIAALELDAVIVAVDGFTALGGAQWVDSPAIGSYGRYLCEDVVGTVDAGFRTLAEPAHRGLAGSSSGGFGAMVWALLRPDLFGAFATHAGDGLFEATLAAEFPPAAQALRNLYGGSFEAFWADFRSGRPVLENRTDPLLQNVYATSAAFSATPDGTVELPFSLDTGVIREDVFARWLARDPVRLAAEHADALGAARAVWIDAGRNDEYRLDLAAIAFRDAALAAGLPGDVLHFELFDGGHRRLGRRLLESLPFLVERLGP